MKLLITLTLSSTCADTHQPIPLMQKSHSYSINYDVVFIIPSFSCFCSFFSPFFPLESCCSSGWSLFLRSQTPPRTPARPSWETVWCAPPAASSSRQCPPSPLLPSRFLPSVPATRQKKPKLLPSLARLWNHHSLSEICLKPKKTFFPTHFVNKIQRHSSLPDPHLFWLPVFPILSTDSINTFLQASGGLILLPILLPLHKNNLILVSLIPRKKENSSIGRLRW